MLELVFEDGTDDTNQRIFWVEIVMITSSSTTYITHIDIINVDKMIKKAASTGFDDGTVASSRYRQTVPEASPEPPEVLVSSVYSYDGATFYLLRFWGLGLCSMCRLDRGV